jgi:hypothetical protein
MPGHKLLAHRDSRESSGAMPLRSGRVRAGVCAALVAAAVACSQVHAQVQQGNQLPQPRLSGINPTGARPGASLEVTFHGSDLEDPELLLFSHPGIKAVAVIPPPPPAVKPDPKKPAPKPPPPQPITRFKITVAPDVPPGFYDVRFGNKWGISNPRTFVVGDLKEIDEKEPNNEVEQGQRVELGTTINGMISAPTDVDYSVFAGKKGQRVLIACLGPSIDSRLYPEIRLYDQAGRELAVSRPAPGLDAVLDLTLPADGDYVLRLCQFTYAGGGPEYFYRLNISTAPWIDLVFPPMVEAGKTAQVTILGRNLPGGQPSPGLAIDGRPLDKIMATVTAPGDAMAQQRLEFSGNVSPIMGLLDGFEYRIKGPGGTSNPFLLTFAKAPVILENDANDTPDKAQEVAVPAEIAGRIDKPNDHDWYSFTAKKGDVYVLELFSHRLGAPTDLFMSLRSMGGKQELANLDDQPAALTKNFFTVHQDPQVYRFAVPADGKYHVLVGHHVSHPAAGPKSFYQLRIAREAPDFRLVVMPADDFRPDACTMGRGGHLNYVVYADRRDGFNGPINLSVDGLPSGVTCPPQLIAAKLKENLLVLHAAANAPIWTGTIKVKGTAVINGQTVTREARPASIVWAVPQGQNFPTLTRLDRGLVLAVRDKAPYRLDVSPDKVTITHGGKANVKLALDRIWPDNKAVVQIQPIGGDLPPNVKFANVTIAADKKEAALVLEVPATVPPGNYTVSFRSFAPVPFSKNPAEKKKPNVNVVLPSAPVSLNVLPREVAKLTVPGSINVKAGSQAELLVRVARLHEFNDAIKVQLMVPPHVQGIGPNEAVIPAGQNEVKLLVRAAAGAVPGNRPNLVVRAVAVWPGNVVLNHEAKFNVNVVK